MTTLRRTRVFAAIALLTGALLLSACGATAAAPENVPADTTAPATFGEATFDASTWR